jgi:glyoxylase-like metal-dependent hydrolase (beta-lactamase superfamily II)
VDPLITPLSDGELHIPAQALLNRDLPPEFTDAEGLMAVNFGGYLVRTPEHTVVVDTGIGGGAIPELPIGSFPDRLRAAGVAPEDVDTVIFTHLHFDHVGWSGLFTAARFHVHAIDWRYWVTDATPETGPGREDFGAVPAPERLAPLAGRVTQHDGERTEIVPGITLRLAPGHSPGHCIVEVGDDHVLLADAAHNPAQLLADDYRSATDVDAELAARTRASLAEELTGSGKLIAMTHHPGSGRLEVRDGRRCWTWTSAGGS